MSDDEEKKKIAIIYTSVFMSVAMTFVILFGLITDTHNFYYNNVDNNQKHHVSLTMKVVKILCHPTDYKQECEQSLIPAAGNITDKKELVKIAFNVTMAKISDKLKQIELLHKLEKEPRAKMALETCKQLMDLSIDEFVRSIDKFAEDSPAKHDNIFTSMKVWLSGSITYQDTCLDGFENTTSDASKKMKDLLTTSMHMSSNVLAIITMANIVPDINVTKFVDAGHRHLLQNAEGELSFHLPTWVDNGANVHSATSFKIKPNVTVALDGSGDVKKINDALTKVPENNKKPFVIYIKEGVYNEYVEISKDTKHVVFFGDGSKKTRITGNRNYMDGFNTYKTPTVAVLGDNFVAINVGIENSAGPHKHQAVAIRVQADKAIFYKCSFDGYQDTLYAHTHRQFYKDCIISGTTDFIFGDALAVFQNCTFIVRKPLEHQPCIVTAQGRKDKNQPSGFVIQGGRIAASPKFNHEARLKHKPYYLASPWKNFSRTIFMDTYIDDLINPEGYLPRQGPKGPLHMDTCFYSEYHNFGPGSDKSKRARWSGIWNHDSKTENWFSSRKFFNEDDWIEATGIPYYSKVQKHNKHKPTLLDWLENAP